MALWQLALSMYISNFAYMNVTQVFRQALRYVTDTSVETVAAAANYSRQAFDGYLNRAPPSTAAILALALVLRERARRLERWAERLEAAADERDRGGPK